MLLLAAALLLAGERATLGIWERWGAFRDSEPARCFAIAQPLLPGGRTNRGGAFASVAGVPGAVPRHSVFLRLSRRRGAAAAITLAIGERRFALVGDAVSARAPDAATDRAIVAAMRGAPAMSVSTISVAGQPFADRYPLRGAATAIDAAILGCVGQR